MAAATGLMAGASLFTSAAGGILGAMGAAQKDDATAAMYNYKAGVAQANQQIALKNAAYEQDLGGVQAQLYGLKGGQEIGQMKVAQAASGLAVGSGTAAEARTSQMAGITTGEAGITSAAARRAYGYDVQAYNFMAEAGLDTQAARFTEQQKGLDIASSLLGGASSVADKWTKFSTAGVFG